jgi:hypothetical protein
MRLPTAHAGRLYAGEYRELGIKLRELARTYVFPGSKRSLLRLARAFDRRAAHFDTKAAGGGRP